MNDHEESQYINSLKQVLCGPFTVKTGRMHLAEWLCSVSEFIRRVSDGFPDGLLPVSPVCRRKRAECVLAVRAIGRYVQST